MKAFSPSLPQFPPKPCRPHGRFGRRIAKDLFFPAGSLCIFSGKELSLVKPPRSFLPLSSHHSDRTLVRSRFLFSPSSSTPPLYACFTPPQGACPRRDQTGVIPSSPVFLPPLSCSSSFPPFPLGRAPAGPRRPVGGNVGTSSPLSG